ncbi:MAG: MarR family transcriptional regulator, partial [Candidatus Promineifilaceae bacterium]|nr:MarR family transcriptional regulator [Candidatus Promineifilaceae bacterium]
MTRRKEPPSEEQRKKWVAFMQMVAPDVNPRAIQLMDQMRMVAHSLYQIGELSVAATGLSYAKMRLLIGLLYSAEVEGRADGVNPSEISERQGTSRNTISSLIRDLEEEGLIRRTLDPDDRRRFNIQLTEAGQELVLAHVTRHLHVLGDCFAVLDGAQHETLSRLLGELGAKVDETHEALSESPPALL